MSEDVPTCVICGSLATERVDDPAHVPSTTRLVPPPNRMPPVDLCEEHWTAFHSDWVLLGWCVDHYAEALRICPIHHRLVDPL
jgi:hypothetical protein